MNQFKSIMLENHTKGRENLHYFYTDRHVYRSSVSSSEQEVAEEKLYHYRELAFQFAGTNYRTPENLLLFVYIPEQTLACSLPFLPYITAYEDYLLRLLSGEVNQLSDSYQNTHKHTREKPQFAVQTVNSVIQTRNGCVYMEHKKAFRLRIHFQAPLINGTWINGKSGFKAVKALLNLISDKLEQIIIEDLQEHIRSYARQLEIRRCLMEKNLAAFIADGSILPRKEDSDEPMTDASPFYSPKEQRIELELPSGGKLTGMGLSRGITVITGGGYSGKSTLLDSLEMGIYNHVRGDGREYVITDASACKIYAEDGRCVRHTDISPFFSYMPGRQDTHDFSTPKGSGSVSQAVNIIEAVYGGSRLLLIDEDTSATNFMIRDEYMRQLVRKEPIIPFTDRVEELKARGISTVLVIGGSSEYLKYADSILLMEDYQLWDKTARVRNILQLSGKAEAAADQEKHPWTEEKHVQPPVREKSAGIGSIQTERTGYIRIGSCTADLTKMTAVISEEQINALAYLMEKLMSGQEQEERDLRRLCEAAAEELYTRIAEAEVCSSDHKYGLWLEQVRPLDLLMAVCRLRYQRDTD